MYKLLRDLHLIAGLFSAVFLLGYGLSALQMAYPIYRPQPRQSKQTIPVPADVDDAPRSLARWLMDAHDLRGDLTTIETSSTTTSLAIVRPGTSHRVQFDREKRIARVTTNVLNAIGMLNRIHHVAGIAHEYGPINAWSWCLFVVSIGLFVLATSGTIMWFQRHRERGIGTIVFLVGLAWGLTLLILVRTA